MPVCMLSCFSHVQLFATLWRSPPGSSVYGIFQAGIWSRLPIPSPGHLPNLGIEPAIPGSPVLARGFFTTVPPGMPLYFVVKRLPEMRETWVQSLGWEDLLEKEMTTHSSILAWKIPWTEEPGRLQSMGSQRVGYN